jgi:hypothetical protein
VEDFRTYDYAGSILLLNIRTYLRNYRGQIIIDSNIYTHRHDDLQVLFHHIVSTVGKPENNRTSLVEASACV